MRNLDAEDIFFLSPGLDEVGRVFYHKNFPKKVLRSINPEYEKELKRFIGHPRVFNEPKLGLIKASLINFRGNPTLVHPLLEPLLYPHEWSRLMHKNALVSLLRLCQKLKEFGYFVQDTHSQNFTFSGGKPIFLDWGAITRFKKVNFDQWYEGIVRFFLLPMIMFSLGEEQVYRNKMFFNTSGGVSTAQFLTTHGLRKLSVKLWYLLKLRRLQIEQISDLVEKIYSFQPSGYWTGYYPSSVKSDNPSTWNIKHKSVAQIIQKIRPKSVVDIAGNNGLILEIAQKASTHKLKTALIDNDEAAVDQAFLGGKISTCIVSDFQKLNISPLDLANPDYPRLSINDRLSADLVLVLALVHHLALTQGMRFHDIARVLKGMRTKYIAIEYVKRNDPHIQSWLSSKNNWYSQARFEYIFRQHFKLVTIFKSNLETRLIYLFANKR